MTHASQPSQASPSFLLSKLALTVFFLPNMIMIYRISGTDSGTDSGVPMPVQTRVPRGRRGARGRRCALPGGLSPAGTPGKKPAQRADGVLNAGPAGDDGLKFAKGSPCPMLATALGPIRPCVKAVTEKGLRGVVALQCGSNHTERMSTQLLSYPTGLSAQQIAVAGRDDEIPCRYPPGRRSIKFTECCVCNSANGNTPEELTIHYNHQQSFFRILRCSSFMRLCTVYLCTTDIQSVMEQSMLRLSAAGSQLLTPSQSSHSSIYY